MTLNVDLDDDGLGLDLLKDVPGGDGDCRGSDDLLPLVVAGVELLPGDEVRGPGHVAVLGLQVGVQLLALLVTDGVVQDLHIALVGHLVAHGDEGEVVVDRVQHHHLPLHGGHGEAVGADVGPDVEQDGLRVVDHGLDEVVRQPGFPGTVDIDLSGDVIELMYNYVQLQILSEELEHYLGIVDTDDGPEVLEEGLAHVDTGVGDDTGEVVERITEISQQTGFLLWLDLIEK